MHQSPRSLVNVKKVFRNFSSGNEIFENEPRSPSKRGDIRLEIEQNSCQPCQEFAIRFNESNATVSSYLRKQRISWRLSNWAILTPRFNATCEEKYSHTATQWLAGTTEGFTVYMVNYSRHRSMCVAIK